MSEYGDRLRQLMKENLKELSSQWLHAIYGTYPRDTSDFLKTQRDRFLNPVGYTFSNETGIILAMLVNGIEEGQLLKSLDAIVKIRAVQEYKPSESMSLFFLLKEIIHKQYFRIVIEEDLHDSLFALDREIDGIALRAFDLFVQCRERICEIKVKEAKDSTFKLMERMNKLYGQSDDSTSSKDSNN